MERFHLYRPPGAGGAFMAVSDDGPWVKAADYDAMLDAQRGLTAKAEAETAEARKRAANAERYVAGEDLRSDFATAAEMRAALDAATRRLALAVAEVKAWREADGEHDWTGETNGPQHMITSVMFAMGATNADPELAKMIGAGGVG